jgi:hypothetical protein
MQLFTPLPVEALTVFSFIQRFLFGRRRTDSPRPVQARLMIIVEGRHDIEFLRRISSILHAAWPSLPDLTACERCGDVLFVPAGGGDFRPWLTRLSGLGRAEFHLYDREVAPVSQQREQWAALVNARPRCRAFVTRHRALENYLHPHAIREARGLVVTFSETDDVAAVIAQAAFIPSDEMPTWDHLSRRARRRQRDRVKSWLNTEAVERMTLARLAESDPAGDVLGWLTVMGAMLTD